MDYELDILQVGKESSCGDAMCMRYGDLTNPTKQNVVVIDGGYQKDGKKIVDEYIHGYYNTDYIDLVISTHPDTDHISGLFEVLENVSVGKLWMHKPWDYSDDIKALVRTGSTHLKTLKEHAQKSYQKASALAELANQKNITIEEPFAGVSFDDTLTVLGPTVDYYRDLMIEIAGGKAVSGPSLLEKMAAAAKKAWHTIYETWDKDTLVEPADDAVSPRNNSSTIILVTLDNKRFLLTGDAGVPALMRAADYADQNGTNLRSTIGTYQIPHHGSKRNLGPRILNRIVGDIVGELNPNQPTGRSSFVLTAAKADYKHPSMRITIAFYRRGVRPYGTSNGPITYFSGQAPRRSMNPATPISWVNSHKEEED